MNLYYACTTYRIRREFRVRPPPPVSLIKTHSGKPFRARGGAKRLLYRREHTCAGIRFRNVMIDLEIGLNTFACPLPRRCSSGFRCAAAALLARHGTQMTNLQCRRRRRLLELLAVAADAAPGNKQFYALAPLIGFFALQV